jgi:hypothetical protein
MRPLSAIAAFIVIACAAPMTSRADGPPPAAASEAAVAQPGCRCPGIRHVRRVHHVRRYARHWRRPVLLVRATAPLPVYDPPIPSPWDTAYDRAMTLHFRSPEVSGTYVGEPGYPHTPPIHGVQSYRVRSGDAVLQYDGLIGEYIMLAQADARLAFPPPPPPAPVPPAVPPAR